MVGGSYSTCRAIEVATIIYCRLVNLSEADVPWEGAGRLVFRFAIFLARSSRLRYPKGKVDFAGFCSRSRRSYFTISMTDVIAIFPRPCTGFETRLEGRRGATKMSSTENRVKRKRNRRQRACIGCNERKVKCDLLKPCSECRRRGVECHYVKRTIETLTKSALRQVVNRMTVEMDIYKKLESYWRNLAESARLGHLTAQEETKALSLGTVADLSDKTVMMTLSTLFMFSRYAEMILPQYSVHFEAQTAKNYWALLSRTIHFDLNRDFDDASFVAEKKSHGVPIKRAYGSFPTHSTEDALVGELFQDPEAAMKLKHDPTDSTSTEARPDVVLPPYHEQPKTFSRELDDGVLVSSTGRFYDSLDDFMKVKLTSATDLVSLLEYGVAFLTGLYIMEAEDVMTHFSINCRRVLNELIMLHRHELKRDLAVRVVNCSIIMAFHYAAMSNWATLNSVLLFAHGLAVDHELHSSEPVLSARLYLVLLWYTRTQEERELYMNLCRQYFPSGGDIDFRCKYSYISSALRSQSAQEDSRLTEEGAYDFWKRVESYMDDCDSTFAIMDKFGLKPCTLVMFRIIANVMRAEIGPRLGEHDWPIEQGLALQKEFSQLDDIHTLASLCYLKRFCHELEPHSVMFEYQGKVTKVATYMLGLLESISCPPSFVAPEAELRAQTQNGFDQPTFAIPTISLEPYEQYTAAGNSPEGANQTPSSSSASSIPITPDSYSSSCHMSVDASNEQEDAHSPSQTESNSNGFSSEASHAHTGSPSYYSYSDATSALTPSSSSMSEHEPFSPAPMEAATSSVHLAAPDHALSYRPRAPQNAGTSSHHASFAGS